MDSQDLDRDVAGEDEDAPPVDRHDREGREPIGEWADRDDTAGFGVRQPPGG
jgi:hypothetical protein